MAGTDRKETAELARERLAVLIAQYPAINHSVILSEIRELRRTFALHTVSIRAPDRSAEKMSAVEREEASQTFYVKPGGVRASIVAVAQTLFVHPVGFLRGLVFALRLSGARIGQTFKNLAYFAEAVIVAQWMMREGLRHLHSHYSSTVGLLVKQVFPIELSISFHGPDEFTDPKGFWLKQKIEASLFVRAISHYARSQLMLHSDSEHWPKIEVAYMGVDPQEFSPREFRENPDPLEIICVARLAPVKAQRVLISAVAELVQKRRNVLLHIVGGGPDRRDLEEYVETLALRTCVTFHGFTVQVKLYELYRRSDVFALASFAEGLPGVLMEAMAMEIPCISTWIAGVPELIRDGIDGLLVPPANPGAFALAISRLIDDRELRRRIGTAGRERVLTDFHLRNNATHLANIFKRRAFPLECISGTGQANSP